MASLGWGLALSWHSGVFQKRVNPVSEKPKQSKYSQGRTDTLLGAGTRFEGNVSFVGVLRIEGEVVGDVTCGADPQGMVVVGKSGCVTGAVVAPHVLVIGRVTGSVTSSGSFEILPDACIKGDATYSEMVVHEGGVIEGLLTPQLAPAGQGSGAALASQPVAAADKPAGSPWRRRGFALAGLAAVGLAAVLWFGGNTSPRVATPVVQVMPKVEAPRLEPSAPLPEPAASVAVAEPPKVEVASAPVAPAPSPPVAVKEVVPAPPPPAVEPDAKDVAVVKGDDPGKPGDFVYVVAGKEPAVLFRKQAKGAGEGKRIDLPHGVSKRIPLGRDELLRVEQGKGLQIFYQGRKVSPSTLNGGGWIRFVPST